MHNYSKIHFLKKLFKQKLIKSNKLFIYFQNISKSVSKMLWFLQFLLTRILCHEWILCRVVKRDKVSMFRTMTQEFSKESDLLCLNFWITEVARLYFFFHLFYSIPSNLFHPCHRFHSIFYLPNTQIISNKFLKHYFLPKFVI